jgi:hypothetical protein
LTGKERIKMTRKPFNRDLAEKEMKESEDNGR